VQWKLRVLGDRILQRVNQPGLFVRRELPRVLKHGMEVHHDPISLETRMPPELS
jgi:hypothetical protein